MNITGIRRLVVAVGLIALVAILTFGGVVQATTPTPVGHDTHHAAATPASTGACAAPAIGTPTTSDKMGGEMMTGSPMSGQAMQTEFDLMFIDMMIVHHQGAIEMADVALERGEHQEIRDLAQSIISSQQAEIDQMRMWRDAWYPGAAAMPMEQMTGMMGDMTHSMPAVMGSPASEMGDMGNMMGMMDPHADRRALCSTTEDFDTAFITMMIPHHESAVVMAQVALKMATHPEIKQLAQEIIDAQQTEIAQMQTWLATW